MNIVSFNYFAIVTYTIKINKKGFKQNAITNNVINVCSLNILTKCNLHIQKIKNSAY